MSRLREGPWRRLIFVQMRRAFRPSDPFASTEMFTFLNYQLASSLVAPVAACVSLVAAGAGREMVCTSSRWAIPSSSGTLMRMTWAMKRSNRIQRTPGSFARFHVASHSCDPMVRNGCRVYRDWWGLHWSHSSSPYPQRGSIWVPPYLYVDSAIPLPCRKQLHHHFGLG